MKRVASFLTAVAIMTSTAATLATDVEAANYKYAAKTTKKTTTSTTKKSTTSARTGKKLTYKQN